MKDNKYFNELIKSNKREDEYINATKWCKEYSKDLKEFLRNKETKLYIKALEKHLNLGVLNSHPQNPIPVKISERVGRTSQTWVHPLLAIKLAEWLSHEFEIHVKETFKGYLEADIKLADNILQRNNNPKDAEWLAKRAEGKIHRKAFTKVLEDHDVHTWGFGTNTNAIYEVRHGKTAKQIELETGLAPREAATSEDLTYYGATELAASKTIEKNNVRGNSPTAKVTKALAEVLNDILSGNIDI